MRRTAALLAFVAMLLAGGGFAGPAHADWRADFKVFRIGVVAGSNPAYRMRQVEPFRKYMETRLGVPVELVPATDFAGLIDAQASGRISYAVYSASAFATADVRCRCVEPLAVPKAPGGALGFYSILVVRATGPITTLADAKGASLAYTSGPSVAGHLVPFAALAAAGAAPANHFSALQPFDDPEAALRALLRGEADVAVSWSSLYGDVGEGYDRGVFRKLVAAGEMAMTDIRIVWKSPLIPYGPHAVRRDLPDDLKLLLKQALLDLAGADLSALDAIDRDGGVGFAEVDAALYAVVRQVVTGGATE